MTQSTNNSTPTRRERWAIYGLNVSVLILALLVIALLTNYAAYQKRTQLDFTHNRRYTLSPQTRRILQSMDEPITITTLYRESAAESELLAEVDELLTEYELRGNDLHVRHIDPSRDLAQYETLIEDLQDRFALPIAQREAAVDRAYESYGRFLSFAQKQVDPLSLLLTEIQTADANVRKNIETLKEVFQRAPKDWQEIQTKIGQEFDDPLPAYEPVRNLLEQLTTFYISNLDISIELFTRWINDEQTSAAAKDRLRGMRDEFRSALADLAALMEQVGKIEFDRYEEMRSLIGNEACVIVTLPVRSAAEKKERTFDHHGIAVLTLNDLFPQYVTSAEAGHGQSVQQTYKGEEQITGALLRLTLEHRTRVVFINPSSAPALQGPNDQLGSYQVVAQRLRAMNFQVQEWQPTGGLLYGRRIPPGPKPTPKPGETLIFVSLAAASDPNTPIHINQAADLAGAAMQDHVADGRPAMILTYPGLPFIPTEHSGSSLASLEPFGIQVQLDKLVVTPVPGQEVGAMPASEPRPTRDHPIAQAVRGMPGFFQLAQKIDWEKTEGVQHWPLIESLPGTWAEHDGLPLSTEIMKNMSRHESEEPGPITMAVAAQKDDARLVVVAEPFWASDPMTTHPIIQRSNLGVISVYTAYPMNAELFVNSIYWLAGLDDVIAPGAKTQETRRIEDISRGTLTAYRWGLGFGMPILCLLAGIAVWFVRRR